MNRKSEIRKMVKERLAALNKPLYEDKSYRIATKLFQDRSWLEAKTIGVTISNFPEVDTYQIIRKAWELGKRVVVPKCVPAQKQLIFRTLESFAHLESVFFGLYEPVEELTTPVDGETIDLLIVPGLAFGRSGFRIGFGGGYYDRFLAGYHGETISLAFREQMFEELPVEEHDLPVAKIITETEVIVADE
ncbi:5-formyltetrahydrofolate cyclo-ligase [Bacillus sp. V3-13]|uniref:5-formyltetrahydrofolate cyclo-ligase n=1 Tax=Bacillus sp. V3-13 TaxID=2053728 RepID=UPI000C7801E1|nr:5-formyltetrahydrofolate cyclo-ligase [Bacillus sp. V3-13]PLR76955.1 5-formyltetrahydrofolate cyclo-ligase [Bacillus sp. V3-13]